MLSEYSYTSSCGNAKISNSLVNISNVCIKKENEFLPLPFLEVPDCLSRTDRWSYNINNKNKLHNNNQQNNKNKLKNINNSGLSNSHNNKMSDVSVGVWRPRGALARALMERIKNDEHLDNLDQSKWYAVDIDSMETRFQSLWHQLHMDGTTKRWLAGAKNTASNLGLQIYHSIARLLLGLFMTQTDVNGWLHRGSMFVFSTNQLSSLLNAAGYYGNRFSTGSKQIGKSLELKTKYQDKKYENINIDDGKQKNDVENLENESSESISETKNVNDSKRIMKNTNSVFPVKGRLLDLGAGDGDITARMEPLFEDIAVTEVSNTMRNRLAERGYSVLDVNSWMSEGPYDVISCLNLLDRCSNPKSLLRDVRSTLSSNGLVLIALVLPFKPYVEKGTKDHRPLEYLNIHGSTFEQQVESFFLELEKLGFDVQTWTRVPYLCHGDLNQSYYHLDDVLVVASKNEKSF